MDGRLAHGCYTVALGRFEPATFLLEATEHTATPPRPAVIYLLTQEKPEIIQLG